MKQTEPEVLQFNKNDVSFRYMHYRNDGPDLIMLHATGFFPYIWHPVAMQLASDFNIIIPYFCDHRSRDPHEGGFSWKELADDLCILCTELKIDRPYMAGHSMGATVMTIAAGTHDVNPQKMFLIEPIYLPDELYGMEISVDQHPLASKSIKRKNQWDSKEDARTYLQSKQLFSRWDREMLEIYIEHGMEKTPGGELMLICHPEKEASLFMGGNHFNPWPVMQNINCPVCLVEGELSENRMIIDLARAAEVFPDAELVQVEGAGHLIPMEKPGETYSLMKNFLTGN